MKKFYFLLLTISLSLSSFGQIIESDDFNYSDGSLTDNPKWTTTSGTTGDLQVVSGQIVINHGAGTEDVEISFPDFNGELFYTFDFSVEDLGSPYTGSDNEYFAHFMRGSFTARMDIVSATGSGDFSVGIATSSSTADAIWPTDLTFDTTYKAIVKLNSSTGETKLWINATAEGDTSISGAGGGTAGPITGFRFRQSSSSEGEVITIDNLTIEENYFATLSTETVQKNTEFSVYPNPVTNGFVNIKTTSNDAINVTVFDVLGKQVVKQTLTTNRLNVSNLKAGMYLLNIEQNGASTTKKLVIE